jgi:hypothetical protein
MALIRPAFEKPVQSRELGFQDLCVRCKACDTRLQRRRIVKASLVTSELCVSAISEGI